MVSHDGREFCETRARTVKIPRSRTVQGTVKTRVNDKHRDARRENRVSAE
jgi:hypothetical protein